MLIYVCVQVGDEILEVNGQSLLGMSHQDAIRMLKSSDSLMLTVRVEEVQMHAPFQAYIMKLIFDHAFNGSTRCSLVSSVKIIRSSHKDKM